MKSIITSIGLLLTIQNFSQYKPIDSKSTILFKTKTLGVSVNGKFSGLDGNISFDEQHLNEAKFDVTVQTSSVNTDNSLRDDHLKKASFFDVANYSRIQFISTKIVSSNKTGVFIVTGSLTIKNKTKDITFPFTAKAIQNGYLFNGVFKINREDFGVGSSGIISDEVEIDLNVFAENVSK